MCIGRIAEGVSVLSDIEVLVMSVTVDGEDPTRKIFGRAQNGIV